jgi:hypothetical protein
MVNRTVAEFGRIDAAFNNAGVMAHIAPVAESVHEDCDRVIGINLLGVWSCSRSSKEALNLLWRAFVIILGLIGPAMAQERVLISSDWGKVTAELVDNNATRSLLQMLPLSIEMRDHLRQEKTGNLASALPAAKRQLDFSTGTLGLWNSDHFIIYYRDGRVPQPGIILLGRVIGDVSIFDRPGPVMVRVERIE